jgi:hypothetical protein
MPQMLDEAALPSSGNAHELAGYLHGDAPVSIIFIAGPPDIGIPSPLMVPGD